MPSKSAQAVKTLRLLQEFVARLSRIEDKVDQLLTANGLATEPLEQEATPEVASAVRELVSEGEG